MLFQVDVASINRKGIAVSLHRVSHDRCSIWRCGSPRPPLSPLVFGKFFQHCVMLPARSPFPRSLRWQLSWYRTVYRFAGNWLFFFYDSCALLDLSTGCCFFFVCYWKNSCGVSKKWRKVWLTHSIHFFVYCSLIWVGVFFRGKNHSLYRIKHYSWRNSVFQHWSE